MQTMLQKWPGLHDPRPQEAKTASVSPSLTRTHRPRFDTLCRKRELLLNQIRDQAESIKKLMAELEEANKKVKQVQAQTGSNAPSPASTTDFSFISMSDSRLMSPEIEGEPTGTPEATRTRADVQDWIAKARESIQAFDGYINMGGPGVRTSDLLADDEGSDPEAEYAGVDAGDDDEEYALTVDDGEADEPSTDEDVVRVRRLSGPDDAAGARSKGQLATIPSPAAPFGLMAKLHLGSNRAGLRRMKSKSSVGAEEEDDEDVGLANPDFFRPSA